MERHRRSNIHVACVKHQVPSRRTLSAVKNRLIVHVQWKVLDFKKLRVIRLIADTRTDRKGFIPVPEVVGCVDLCFVNVTSAVKVKLGSLLKSLNDKSINIWNQIGLCRFNLVSDTVTA